MILLSTHNHKDRVLKIVQSLLQFKCKHYIPTHTEFTVLKTLGDSSKLFNLPLCSSVVH